MAADRPPRRAGWTHGHRRTAQGRPGDPAYRLPRGGSVPLSTPATTAARWHGARFGRCWYVAVATFVGIRALGICWLSYVGHRSGRSVHDMLTAWDGRWMLAIADHGYGRLPADLTDAHAGGTPYTSYAFFPGYPMVVRLLGHLPGVTSYAAAITTSLVCGVVATAAAYRIGKLCAARRWPSEPARADRAGLLMAVLFAATPMSIVLTMAYSEAIFCAFAGWALVMTLQRRFVAAGALTACAGLTRTTAVALIAVVIVAAFLDRRAGWRPLVGAAIAPLGWLSWIVLVAVRTGEPAGWFQVQSRGWGTRFDAGAATARYLLDTLATNQTAGDVVTAWVILATIGLVVIAVVTRLPWQLTAYGTLATATVLLSTGLMNSRVRLLIPAFVLLTPACLALSQRSRATQVAGAGTVIAVSTWFGAHMLGVYSFAI